MLFRLERSEVQPMAAFLELASDLQDLVSIGVNRTAAFEAMSFFHPAVEHRHASRNPIPIPIDYFVQWKDRESRSDEEMVHAHEMVFSLADIGGMRGVERWLEAAALHRSALNRVMATRMQRSMYVSDRLINRSASLEAFDRVCNGTKRVGFRRRIERCIDYVGPTFDDLIGERHKWLQHVTAARNEAAHHLDRRVLDGSEQYLLAEALYWLFTLCMLRAADVPNTVVDRIENLPALSWLRREMRRALS
jgi:hypothetical protein